MEKPKVNHKIKSKVALCQLRIRAFFSLKSQAFQKPLTTLRASLSILEINPKTTSPKGRGNPLGQGEDYPSGFTPIFMLNHSFFMHYSIA